MKTYNFYFQAEDGIRDLTVTGVQTCALPIFAAGLSLNCSHIVTPSSTASTPIARKLGGVNGSRPNRLRTEIGRASCREREEITVVAGSQKKRLCARHMSTSTISFTVFPEIVP